MERCSSCSNTNAPVWFNVAHVYFNINFPCLGQEGAHASAGRLPALPADCWLHSAAKYDSKTHSAHMAEH